MTSPAEQITSLVGEFWAVLAGLLIVATYAGQRFNEPTFPNRETLPHTVAPLRYLFLKPTYERARRTYVAASLLLYGLLLVPGPEVIAVLGIDAKNFPPQAWALLVALLLVGLLPTAQVKWIMTIEESLRRGVHEWFLVPDGVKKTIAVLEDAPYQPPASQWEAVPDAERAGLEADLRQKRISLRYRWARATMLMTSLNQMGTSAEHPLQKVAFEQFKEGLQRDPRSIQSLGAGYSTRRPIHAQRSGADHHFVGRRLAPATIRIHRLGDTTTSEDRPGG